MATLISMYCCTVINDAFDNILIGCKKKDESRDQKLKEVSKG